uniref:Uncharacterized protein n=1 Tax=uncultured organism TaxID=155900 RepID=A0A7L9QCF5_9ZZZZ|nr:hypothetical protein [uncultured organism]
MGFSIAVAGPTIWEGTPAQIAVQTDAAGYSPDAFDDACNRIGRMFRELFMTDYDDSEDDDEIDVELPPDDEMPDDWRGFFRRPGQ